MSQQSFKPVYLIRGDDHGRIAERRARLKSLAESISGVAGIELLEGEDSSPERVAATLSAMTLALGRRFIIVEGVERWKEGRELDAVLDAVGALDPDTTVAFFAREEGRSQAPAQLGEAVRRAGGDVSVENALKPWELPKWVVARAAERGISLDAEAARALVAHVGERQQRLLRELEKLALGVGAGPSTLVRLDAPEVIALTAPSAQLRAFAVADALVAGDGPGAAGAYLALRDQGERLAGLLYWIAQRVRQALEVAVALHAGESAARIKRGLRMPSGAADRLIAAAGRVGPERLAAATCEIADLELASRGGRATGALAEDSLALLAFERVCA